MECDRLWLKGHFVVVRLSACFTALESPSVGLDELDGIGDDLEGAPGLAIICGPLVLVEDSGNGDPGALVQIGRADFRQLVEGDDLDPAGFLLSGLKCEAEGCYRITVR